MLFNKFLVQIQNQLTMPRKTRQMCSGKRNYTEAYALILSCNSFPSRDLREFGENRKINFFLFCSLYDKTKTGPELDHAKQTNLDQNWTKIGPKLHQNWTEIGPKLD